MLGKHKEPDRSTAWFEQLYRDTYKYVFGYIARRVPEGADDLTADTFLTVWRRRHEVHDISLPWLYGVAAKNVQAAHRKTARRTKLLSKAAHNTPLATVTDHADTVARNTDAVREVDRILNEVSAKDAEILRLWAWEHLEPKDIAIALNISPSAAKARLSRARKRAAAHLSNPNDNVTTLYSA